MDTTKIAPRPTQQRFIAPTETPENESFEGMEQAVNAAYDRAWEQTRSLDAERGRYRWPERISNTAGIAAVGSLMVGQLHVSLASTLVAMMAGQMSKPGAQIDGQIARTVREEVLDSAKPYVDVSAVMALPHAYIDRDRTDFRGFYYEESSEGHRPVDELRAKLRTAAEVDLSELSPEAVRELVKAAVEVASMRVLWNYTKHARVQVQERDDGKPVLSVEGYNGVLFKGSFRRDVNEALSRALDRIERDDPGL